MTSAEGVNLTTTGAPLAGRLEQCHKESCVFNYISPPASLSHTHTHLPNHPLHCSDLTYCSLNEKDDEKVGRCGDLLESQDISCGLYNVRTPCYEFENTTITQ